MTRFDKSGNPVSKVLKNSFGKQVAMKKYGARSVTLQDASGAILHTSALTEGREVKSPMLLCLDKQGNIVRDSTGKPVLVKWFEAKGKVQTEPVWGDAWQITEETRQIACTNCAQSTANRCANVW